MGRDGGQQVVVIVTDSFGDVVQSIILVLLRRSIFQDLTDLIFVFSMKSSGNDVHDRHENTAGPLAMVIIHRQARISF